LAIHAGGVPPCAAVRDILDERIADVDATVAELLTLRRTLVDTRRRADDCCTDDRPVTVCAVIDDA
ncbi:MerR family DNA-binding protein, partial [Mycobacterium kansasii]